MNDTITITEAEALLKDYPFTGPVTADTIMLNTPLGCTTVAEDYEAQGDYLRAAAVWRVGATTCLSLRKAQIMLNAADRCWMLAKKEGQR